MSRIYSFDTHKVKVSETLNEKERWENNQWGSYDKTFKVIEGTSPGKINLNEQHSGFEWISIKDTQSNSIHSYSKIYLNKIKELKAN